MREEEKGRERRTKGSARIKPLDHNERIRERRERGERGERRRERRMRGSREQQRRGRMHDITLTYRPS